MKKLIWIIDEEWSDYEVEIDILRETFPDCEIKISNYNYKEDLKKFGYKADGILAQVYADIPKDTIDKLKNNSGLTKKINFIKINNIEIDLIIKDDKIIVDMLAKMEDDSLDKFITLTQELFQISDTVVDKLTFMSIMNLIIFATNIAINPDIR